MVGNPKRKVGERNGEKEDSTKSGGSLKEARSMAVDPGYDRVGIALFDGMVLIHSECFIPPKEEFPLRLRKIYVHIAGLMEKYRPASLALETLFFTKNQKTAMRVAEARGVIQVAAAQSDITVIEYSPQSVKIAVTGSGSAGKDGVIRMVEKLVSLTPRKRLDDEYDAIALGLAHVHNQTFLSNIHSRKK